MEKMYARQAYSAVLKSREYQEFKKKYPHAFLAHAFTTLADNLKTPWQIGFYDEGTDRVILFETAGEKIIEYPPQEVYKEPGHKVQPLYFDEVTVTADQAVGIVNTRMQESYKGEVAGKHIIILQSLEDHGSIWNITVLSLTFHVINFKIDAKSGAIVHERRELLTTWKK